MRLLTYEPKTGLFVWKEREDVQREWNTKYAGKEAGFDWSAPSGIKYRSIRIFDWPFLAHRLAWVYMTGDWPSKIIDHKDGNGLNNKWSNLREATHRENLANSGAFKTNKLGVRGVSLVPGRTDRYRANIRIDGKQTHLGHFDTLEEAQEAYRQAARKLYGEFAR